MRRTCCDVERGVRIGDEFGEKIPVARHAGLNGLVLWCSHHHHEKHRPGVHALGDAISLRIQLANGTIIDCTQRRTSAAA